MTEAPATRWPFVVLATLAGAVAAMQIGKVPPAIPELRQELALGLVAAGWIASIFNATSAAFGMGAGIVADRLGHRHAVVAGLLALAAGGTLGAGSTTGAALLGARFLEGIGFLVIAVASPSFIARVTDARHLRLAIGLWASYMPVGMAAMMLLSPLLLEAFGWRGLWYANVLLALAVAAAFWTVSRGLVLPVPRRRSWADVRASVGRAGPWLLAACFTCYTLQFFALMAWLPTFLVEDLGAPLSTAAWMTALVVAANMLGNWLGGWLLHRGVERWLVIAVVAATLGFLAVAVFSGPFPVLVKLGFAFLFSAIGGALPSACLAGAPAHAASPAQVGAVNGIIVQGANTGTLLGPPALAGAVTALGGWSEASWLLLAPGAGGVTLALILRSVERRPPEPARSAA
ncbi:MAG: MFS transporter [Gammaproteobacteria bacterium]|nr:MFS transporter [Gammaproteobacteria bacterium]NIR84915.1 MFS transporter [Gammaproteobacteria bacterium]NIR91764.1 MFS transporter [Gammaproteobacteria bacterium]NIU05962.1 MFS transporter [Gammaproteobacteria bacterium]NIV53009.1 MFS transporter [Gammaproteobacteria bacterium]